MDDLIVHYLKGAQHRKKECTSNKDILELCLKLPQNNPDVEYIMDLVKYNPNNEERRVMDILFP
jgi:hypothetical protein